MLKNAVPYDVHMVYAWMTEIKSKVKGMTSGHIYTAYWP